MWTIELALIVIRRLQPEAHKADWHLSLSGGVLNKGHSDNDLDIVAMPRTHSSKASDLIRVLDSALDFDPELAQPVPQAMVYKYSYNRKPIEFVIVQNRPSGDT